MLLASSPRSHTVAHCVAVVAPLIYRWVSCLGGCVRVLCEGSLECDGLCGQRPQCLQPLVPDRCLQFDFLSNLLRVLCMCPVLLSLSPAASCTSQSCAIARSETPCKPDTRASHPRGHMQERRCRTASVTSTRCCASSAGARGPCTCAAPRVSSITRRLQDRLAGAGGPPSTLG